MNRMSIKARDFLDNNHEGQTNRQGQNVEELLMGLSLKQTGITYNPHNLHNSSIANAGRYDSDV